MENNFTGFQLVEKVLNNENGGVEDLLEIANSTELEWL